MGFEVWDFEFGVGREGLPDLVSFKLNPRPQTPRAWGLGFGFWGLRYGVSGFGFRV